MDSMPDTTLVRSIFAWRPSGRNTYVDLHKNALSWFSCSPAGDHLFSTDRIAHQFTIVLTRFSSDQPDARNKRGSASYKRKTPVSYFYASICTAYNRWLPRAARDERCGPQVVSEKDDASASSTDRNGSIRSSTSQSITARSSRLPW